MKCYPVSLHSRFLIQFGLMLWLLCGQKLKCHEIKECPCAKLFCLLLRQHIMLWKLQLFRAFFRNNNILLLLWLREQGKFCASVKHFPLDNQRVIMVTHRLQSPFYNDPPSPLEAGMWNSFYMRPILILRRHLYTDTRCLTKHLIPVISWYKIKKCSFNWNKIVL